MQDFIYKILSFILILILFLSIFILPFFISNVDATSINAIGLDSSFFAWPIPGYTYISSYYGKRKSPTKGASSFHSGIDIPAPENTPLYAIEEGEIIFCSWGAGGGYTIVLALSNYDNIDVSYCHMSPHFNVKLHQKVYKNYCIGYVGPKNVYGINNNPYKDSDGHPTNGATTGTHLHFSIKINGKTTDPLNYFD